MGWIFGLVATAHLQTNSFALSRGRVDGSSLRHLGRNRQTNVGPPNRNRQVLWDHCRRHLRTCRQKVNAIPPSLFVFLLSDPKQNARSLLTPVSGTVFYALLHGSFGFALHGSFFNHLLIGWKFSIANQSLWNRWLMELPWRTKYKLPCKRG